MAPRHSHPAHRNVPDNPLHNYGDDFGQAIRFVAHLAMCSETPGVHVDELTDEIIGLCRKWVEREERTAKLCAEIDAIDDEIQAAEREFRPVRQK